MAAQKEWFEEDYYAILGVEPSASDKDITKKYRVLAKKYHPDANSANAQAEEKFKEVTTAYEVLGDETKRKEYDEVRAMMANGHPGTGGFGFNFDAVPNYGNASPGQEGDLSDLLSGLFSRMRQPGSAQQAQPQPQQQVQSLDVQTQASLSFYQALEGAVTKVTYQLPGSSQSGEVKVKIPAGVNDGQKIKVTGKGLSAQGKKGDLYVVVNVGTHPWFSRQGRTLSVIVPISYPESIVGTQVKVPTLDNPVTLKVPPMTKSGRKVSVKDRGCEINGQKGDLIVTFKVESSDELSDKEKNLYEQLVAEQSVNPRAMFGLEK